MTTEKQQAGASEVSAESAKGSILTYRVTYPNAFGLPILDDSMAPTYLPGNVVVIDPDRRWEDGATCLVKMDDGKASLKVFHDHGSDVIAEPVNGKGPALVAKKGSALDSRVLGKVVGVINDPARAQRMMKLREEILKLNGEMDDEP